MIGTGILKGLAVTAKNFLGSYRDPARLVTEEYPEQPERLPEAYRSFPMLVCEDAADPMGTLRCVACQICEKECPPLAGLAILLGAVALYYYLQILKPALVTPSANDAGSIKTPFATGLVLALAASAFLVLGVAPTLLSEF